MLIKDKDILVNKNEEETLEATQQAPLPRGVDKAHSKEAWGDAFDYYLRGITTKYLQFRGRATRLEFWGFAAVASILYIPLYFWGMFVDVPMLPYYYAIATLVPTFAVMARRLHDINKRSAIYLAITAVLIAFCLFNPMYALVPIIIWAVILVRTLSKETYTDEGLYGEPNEDDEIYGADNQPIIAKFRTIAVLMSVIWFIATGVLFDNWSRQVEQKGVIEQILEDVEAGAKKDSLSPKDIEKAQNAMIGLLKQLDGQAISEKKRQELILKAIQSVKPN